MANWLQGIVAAYRPAYLPGVLLDGPGHVGAARTGKHVASVPGTPARLPATPAGALVDTMSSSPSRLELNP
ncbi:MAG: hypothetical protein ABI178_07180 [Rhodanobacter sp.]